MMDASQVDRARPIDPALGPGAYYVREIGPDVQAFGVILDPAETKDARTCALMDAQGLRLVRAWSWVCSQGECGTEYAENLTPISGEIMAFASENEWQVKVETHRLLTWDEWVASLAKSTP